MRRVGMVCAALYAVALILACGGQARPGSATAASTQPRSRQQIWEGCQESMRTNRCGRDLIAGTICMRQIADEYFGQPTDADAQLVLVRNGCPEPMTR